MYEEEGMAFPINPALITRYDPINSFSRSSSSETKVTSRAVDVHSSHHQSLICVHTCYDRLTDRD